jgi:hypothetical protein
LFVQRRVSIALFLLALFWVGEPAYALWKAGAEHACCLPKAAAVPSCHGMAHDDVGVSVAAQHRHSDCAHDCCTKLRTPTRSAIAARAVPLGSAETAGFIVLATAAPRASAADSVVFDRGPPTTA